MIWLAVAAAFCAYWIGRYHGRKCGFALGWLTCHYLRGWRR